MRLNKFGLEDKQLFEKAYNSIKFPLQENNFKWLFLNSVIYSDMEWAIINENLCLFVTFEGSRYVWGPILPGSKLQETLEKCFEICNTYNKGHNIKKQPALLYIPEEASAQYSELKGFKLKHQNQDYIYDSKQLINLKGGAFKKNRNLISSLLKSHSVKSEIYSGKHEQGCLSLLQKWKEYKLNKVSEYDEKKLEEEACFTKFALKMADKLGLKGMVVLVNDKIEGFTLGEAVTTNICSIFVEKTNLKIKGLAPYIFTEFVKNCWSSFELVNGGEDWGVEYLKLTKMAYHPVQIHKIYMLHQ